MTRPSVIVRPANKSDYPAIAELLDRMFEPRPFEQRLKLWSWRYDANPAKSDTIPPFLVGEWMGQLIGVQGLIPLRVKVKDQIFVASCSCDLAVGEHGHSAGIKIKLEAMSREVSPLHFSTSANSAASEITRALGGREVSAGKRKLIKPLRASGILKHRGHNRLSVARVAGTMAGVLFGKPMDWALAVGRSFRSYPAVPGSEIEDVESFDGRFDELWKTIAEEAVIIQVRDTTYLNWRYARYPFTGIESFAVVRANRVLGLAVIQQSVGSDGLRFVAILELLVPGDSKSEFDQLLGETIRRAAKVGAHMVIARVASPQLEERYIHNGFRLRHSPYSGATYKNNSDISDDVFDNELNWYLSLGDGDESYFLD
jgi:hypothetical protein